MKHRILVATALCCTWLGTLPALAEPSPAQLLRGLPVVDIVIEDPGAAALRCGVQRQHLESALRGALLATPVREGAGVAPYLYLRGLFLSSRNECLYALSLELRSAVSVEDTGAAGVASLWRASLMQAVAIGDASTGVMAAVAAMVDDLATDWVTANAVTR